MSARTSPCASRSHWRAKRRATFNIEPDGAFTHHASAPGPSEVIGRRPSTIAVEIEDTAGCLRMPIDLGVSLPLSSRTSDVTSHQLIARTGQWSWMPNGGARLDPAACDMKSARHRVLDVRICTDGVTTTTLPSATAPTSDALSHSDHRRAYSVRARNQNGPAERDPGEGSLFTIPGGQRRLGCLAAGVRQPRHNGRVHHVNWRSHANSKGGDSLRARSPWSVHAAPDWS
jgi:hypothetical protein